MKIVLFGAPASGKGTQGKRLADDLGLPHISTGDMLRAMREEPGAIGDELRLIPPHAFASDELILTALAAELAKPAYAKGVIFEGFPRTLAQAQAMKGMGLEPDIAINLPIDESLVMDRAVNRRIHQASGRSYNVLFNPPKREGVDDVTGEPLIHRRDDHASIIQERLDLFRDLTVPAINYMKGTAKPGEGPVWVEVDAGRPMNDVSADLDLGMNSAMAIRALRAGKNTTVTVESPYAGDIAKNEAYARAALRDCLLRGEAPFASHLLYTQPGVLDDTQSAQRRLGIEAGLVFAQKTGKTVVYADLGMTPGMEEGIARAHAAGRPVERRSLPGWAPEVSPDEPTEDLRSSQRRRRTAP
jgi:adenylate kinase